MKRFPQEIQVREALSPAMQAHHRAHGPIRKTRAGTVNQVNVFFRHHGTNETEGCDGAYPGS